MNNNPFVLAPHEYQRDLNILGHYLQDTATYLAKMTGKTIEECTDFVRAQVKPGGQFAFKDPEILFLEREANGDRVKKTGTLSRYIGDAIKDKELIAPTLTTYLNPKQCKSLLVDFIDGNVKARSSAKKAQFAARVNGDKATEIIKKIEQTNRKLSNNSISGAHVSASTPLYNKTAHSTLTSNCRSTAGYGNANNEKFLCGNRHYWSPDIVRNNIISIINQSDYAAIDATLKKFGIRVPTVDECMQCIDYSARLYWRDQPQYDKLRHLLTNLTDLERAAFVYTGDLYHLRKFNEGVIREFITKIATRIGEPHPDPDSVFATAHEDYVHLANQICPKEMAGQNLNSVKGTPAYGIVASTVRNIENTIQEYGDMIRTFFVTPNVPASVAHFPDSIRRAALTSDTDSTIFTVQDWVIWHRGGAHFDDFSKAVAASMIFLAAQSITHVLARMSANFGIETERIHQVAMKNEFKFDVFVPTQVAKHYFALIGCQEGNVFEEYDKEIKGVHLKSSNAPKMVMKEAKKMMEDIMYSILNEKPITIAEFLKRVGDLERSVVESIKKGSHEYFRKGQIKTPESYTKNEEESPYNNYLMWKEVFADKYGEVQKPPYTCIKVSTLLDTPTKTKEWLAAMEDRDLAQRMENWMMKYKGRICPMTTFQLPEQCIVSNGIPPEILSVVGIRKMILDTTNVFYLILETLGIYMLNDKTSRLVSDIY